MTTRKHPHWRALALCERLWQQLVPRYHAPVHGRAFVSLQPLARFPLREGLLSVSPLPGSFPSLHCLPPHAQFSPPYLWFQPLSSSPAQLSRQRPSSFPLSSAYSPNSHPVPVALPKFQPSPLQFSPPPYVSPPPPSALPPLYVPPPFYGILPHAFAALPPFAPFLPRASSRRQHVPQHHASLVLQQLVPDVTRGQYQPWVDSSWLLSFYHSD
mmetsp:Transcript_31196/g.46590  ORF Transcript_31196/g.46590 Transcript_31196/m.46590 type:complete len:213 (-) Transcript_31196:1374-2012(-)